MSFSFRKLFKKSEQDSGVGRTRLQFVRPQEQALPASDRSPSAADPEALTAEDAFTSSAVSLDEGQSSGEVQHAADVQSPFQIAEPLSRKPERPDASPPEPFQPAEAAVAPASEVSGAGEELAQEVPGLFDAAPKLPVEVPPAGFFQSVMENGSEDSGEDPGPFSLGAGFSDEPSALQDNSPPEHESFLSADAPGGVEPVSSLHELPWVDDDPVQNQGEPSPFSVEPSDSLTARHGQPVPDPAGEIGNGLSDAADELPPFSPTGPVPVAPEEEHTQSRRPFEDDSLAERPQPYSFGIPDGTDQFAGFSGPSADVDLPEQIDASGALPAGSDHQDFPKEENPVSGKDCPLFAAPASNDEVRSMRFAGEGGPAGTHPAPSGLPDFSPDVEKGTEEPLSGRLDPPPLPVSADASLGIDPEESLAEAGPWPMEGISPLLEAHFRPAEPLESLSPLVSDLPGEGGPADHQGNYLAEQEVSQGRDESDATSAAGQPTLRALLMTDAGIDGEMVVGHCADLDGVHQCVACTSDGRVKASSMPGGSLKIDFLGLLGSVRTLTEAFGAGMEGPLTLRSSEGLVSFFVSGNACLGVLHSEGALKSGVQERLWLIAGALDAECQ